jgi:hypothetical protein
MESDVGSFWKTGEGKAIQLFFSLLFFLTSPIFVILHNKPVVTMMLPWLK